MKTATYKPKGDPRFAFHSDYGVTYHRTDWGSDQVHPGPHMVMVNIAKPGDVYGCSLEEFEVYEWIDETAGLCVKRDDVRVEARRVLEPTYVDTLEGLACASPGSWVVTNTKGNSWPVADDVFTATYTKE